MYRVFELHGLSLFIDGAKRASDMVSDGVYLNSALKLVLS
jgi:hypothetical protein